MHAEHDVKSRLPFPFNEDLSPVLQRLARVRPDSRRRLANDPVTAGYLAAALRLIERNLGARSHSRPDLLPRPPGRAADVDADGGQVDGRSAAPPGEPAAPPAHSLLGFLSQRAVAAEVENNPDPFPRRGSVPTLRDRWRTQADFLADLLTFVLWTGYYPPGYIDVLVEGGERLATAPGFAAAVEQVAYAVTEHVIAMSSFRVQLAASIGAQDHPELREVLGAKYARGRERWSRVYERMIKERGLRLREGMTLTELTDILTATVEGCALRAIAVGPDAGVTDPARGYSLLGAAALAILRGCLEPAHTPDGLGLRDAVDGLVIGD